MGKKVLVKHAVVTRSNKLLEARYKLSVIEQKIIYAIVSIIDSRNEVDFPEFKFNVKDLGEFCGIHPKNIYRDIEEITKTLLGKVIVITDGKRKIQTHWVQSAVYDSGTVVFELDKKLKPYLLELKTQFTSIKISELTSFKSQYSGRIFELLYQHRTFGERYFELEEFRNILGLEKKEYSLFSNLKARVIEKVVQDINKNTSLNVSYEMKKDGAKVVALLFSMRSKPVEPKPIPLFSPADQARAEASATLSPQALWASRTKEKKFISDCDHCGGTGKVKVKDELTGKVLTINCIKCNKPKLV